MLKNKDKQTKLSLLNVTIYLIILITYMLTFKRGLNNNIGLGILLLMGFIQVYTSFILYKSDEDISGEREQELKLRENNRSLSNTVLEIVDKLKNSSSALEEKNDELINNLRGINNSIEEIAIGSTTQAQDTQQIYGFISELGEIAKENDIDSKEVKVGIRNI